MNSQHTWRFSLQLPQGSPTQYEITAPRRVQVSSGVCVFLSAAEQLAGEVCRGRESVIIIKEIHSRSENRPGHGRLILHDYRI